MKAKYTNGEREEGWGADIARGERSLIGAGLLGDKCAASTSVACVAAAPLLLEASRSASHGSGESPRPSTYKVDP